MQNKSLPVSKYNTCMQDATSALPSPPPQNFRYVKALPTGISKSGAIDLTVYCACRLFLFWSKVYGTNLENALGLFRHFQLALHRTYFTDRVPFIVRVPFTVRVPQATIATSGVPQVFCTSLIYRNAKQRYTHT